MNDLKLSKYTGAQLVQELITRIEVQPKTSNIILRAFYRTMRESLSDIDLDIKEIAKYYNIYL